jgi:hypothetical protein
MSSRPLSEHVDVYGLLHEVRLRPGMWVRQIAELETMLTGYGMALEVHGIDEPNVFGAHGHFTRWLEERYRWGMSCGWAYAIVRTAGEEEPLDVFFRLVDEYREAGEPRYARR